VEQRKNLAECKINALQMHLQPIHQYYGTKKSHQDIGSQSFYSVSMRAFSKGAFPMEVNTSLRLSERLISTTLEGEREYDPAFIKTAGELQQVDRVALELCSDTEEIATKVLWGLWNDTLWLIV